MRIGSLRCRGKKSGRCWMASGERDEAQRIYISASLKYTPEMLKILVSTDNRSSEESPGVRYADERERGGVWVEPSKTVDARLREDVSWLRPGYIDRARWVPQVPHIILM